MAKERGDSLFGNVYEHASCGNPQDVYDNWAERYDADNAALGFRLPGLACAFAARHLPPEAGPILDAGAGTGQVGSTLKVLGYPTIVGCDISEEMLAVAASTGAYAELRRQTLGEKLDYGDNSFDGVLCIGSFGPGHAPPESLDELLRVTRPGAPIIFNLREDTWEEQGFAVKLQALTDAHCWTLLEERGPFRPFTIGEPNLFARLFVYRKT